MNKLILLGVASAVVILFGLMAVALFRLRREQKKMKRAYQVLSAQIQRSSDDVAGLCSAAIAVDKRVLMNELRMNDIQESIEIQQSQFAIQSEQGQVVVDESEHQEPQAYEQAIEQIRRGASVDELVRVCGLTRDEAVLLMRLHAH